MFLQTADNSWHITFTLSTQLLQWDMMEGMIGGIITSRFTAFFVASKADYSSEEGRPSLAVSVPCFLFKRPGDIPSHFCYQKKARLF